MLCYRMGDTVSPQGGQGLAELAPFSAEGEGEKGCHRL